MQFSTAQKKEEAEVIKTAQFKEDYKQSLLVDEEILMSRTFALTEQAGFEDVTGELLEFEDQDDTGTEDEGDFGEYVVTHSAQQRYNWIKREIIMNHGLNGVAAFYAALDNSMRDAFDDLVEIYGGWASMLIRFVGYNPQSVLSVVED